MQLLPLAGDTRAGAPTPSVPPVPRLPPNTDFVFPLPHALKLWGLRESRGGSRVPNTAIARTPYRARYHIDHVID